MKNIVESLGMENVSASYVSTLASELDERVSEFLERPIESPMKFIYIDATYFKVRENGKYGNKALYVCIGINLEGGKYFHPGFMIPRVKLNGNPSLMT